MPIDTAFNDTIFRLGSITRHRRVENDGILSGLAEIANQYIGADIVYLSVQEASVSGKATHCVVLGPWEIDQSSTFLDQSRWSAEDRVVALQLETRPADTLHRKGDLIDEALFRDSRLYKEFHKPMNMGDMAAAHHSGEGKPTVVFSISTATDQGLLDEGIIERAEAILPALFRAFDEAWKPVPAWVETLKPQAKRILQHVLDGHDDEQIAAATGLTYHSVRAHLKRLFRVAEVRSRLHLMQAYLAGETSESLDRKVADAVKRRETNGSATPQPQAATAR